MSTTDVTWTATYHLAGSLYDDLPVATRTTRTLKIWRGEDTRPARTFDEAIEALGELIARPWVDDTHVVIERVGTVTVVTHYDDFTLDIKARLGYDRIMTQTPDVTNVRVQITVYYPLPTDYDLRYSLYGTVDVQRCIEIDFENDPAAFLVDYGELVSIEVVA